MNFLLDTNTIIYLINNRLAMGLPAGRYGVSVITEIELLSFPDLQVANAVLFSNDGKLASIPNLQLRAVPLKS